jgi:hypothetical protein
LKLDALDHPKTLDFAARLNVELPTAIGYLELLWAFTGKKASQGNVGKWPDGAIARACYWMGRPEDFILALRDSGFIDADVEHRFTVHDWSEHAPGWVRAKLKKLQLGFISSSEASIEPTSEGTSDDSSKPSIQGKGREEKGRESARARGDDPLPPVEGLDTQAWERWLDYRTKIRKPLKQVSIPAAQQELAAFGSDQAAVVQQSIAQGWQGLFTLKTSPAKPKVPEPKRSREFPQ